MVLNELNTGSSVGQLRLPFKRGGFVLGITYLTGIVERIIIKTFDSLINKKV